jgi:hypothetical protein
MPTAAKKWAAPAVAACLIVAGLVLHYAGPTVEGRARKQAALLITLERTTERTPQQAAVIEAPGLVAWCSAHGLPRPVARDIAQAGPGLLPLATDAAKKTLPQTYILDKAGVVLWSGPTPSTAAALIAELNRFAHAQPKEPAP